MKKLVPVMLATVAAFALSGCTKGAEAAADTSKIADAIKAQEAGWQKGYADKDINVLAGEYADQVVLLQKGKCLRVGAPASVYQRDLLEQVFRTQLTVETGASGRPRVSFLPAPS